MGKNYYAPNPFIKEELREKCLFDEDNFPKDAKVRAVKKDEIVIEFDEPITRVEAVESVKTTYDKLCSLGYSVEVYDHNGVSPHLHVKNIKGLDELTHEQRKKYILAFCDKYVLPKYRKYTDESFTDKFRWVALENVQHYKGNEKGIDRGVKKLIHSNEKHDNKLEDDLLEIAKSNVKIKSVFADFKNFPKDKHMEKIIENPELVNKSGLDKDMKLFPNLVPYLRATRNEVVADGIAYTLAEYWGHSKAEIDGWKNKNAEFNLISFNEWLKEHNIFEEETKDTKKEIWNRNKKGEELSLIYENLADNIMLEHRFVTSGEKIHEVYYYKDGVYVLGGSNFISELSEKATKGKIRNHGVNEVVGVIKRRTFKKREDIQQDIELICVSNGILNIKTRTLEPHTPDKIFFQKIPHNYNPKADCEKFKKYLKDVLGKEEYILIQEKLGFCLKRKYFIKKAFIFVGGHDTSKTTLINVIVHFVGKENTSGVSLHKIAGDKFAVARLENKYLNYYDDLSNKDLSDVGAFKIVVGGGYTPAEKKFGESFEFQNYAKLLFATNKIVGVQDLDDDAYYNRWVVIRFWKEILKKIPNFWEQLTTEEEMEGILNFALDGLDRLEEQKDFSYDKSAREIKSIMQRDSDPVAAFTQDCLVHENDSWISKEDMYNLYSGYVNYYGGARETKTKFTQKLTKLCKYIHEGRRDCESQASVHGWLNVKLNINNGDLEVDDEIENPLNTTFTSFFDIIYNNNDLLFIPKNIVNNSIFSIIRHSKKISSKSSIDNGEAKEKAYDRAIFSYIKNNPNLSTKEIAEKKNYDFDETAKAIDKLAKDGEIFEIKPDRYKIVE
jgi:putative DNA primase/helicase